MTKEQKREYNRRKHEEAKLAYAAFMTYYPLTLENLDGEEWKPIEGFEGYEISNFGRVKSFKKGKAIIRKPVLNIDYLAIGLWIGCKKNHRLVHRLVAEAFLPNPDNKPEVNHRVGCKFNCHVSNLVWSTSSENTQHAIKNGLRKSGVDDPQAKIKNEADIIYIRENPDNLTGKELAEKFGMTPAAISKIQIGKTYENAGGSIRQTRKKTPRIPDEIRAAIRADWATGQYTQRELARKYGVSQGTIRKIINESA